MIKKINRRETICIFFVFFLLAIMMGCKGDSGKNSGQQAAKEKDVLSGKVEETMNSGGYTYILLNNKGKNLWVAVPEIQVSKGDQVCLAPGMEVCNFTSRTLNRTFEKIILSSGPVSEKVESAEEKMKAPTEDLCPSAMKIPASNAMGITAKIEDIKIEKAEGESAYTVAEVYEKRSDLSNTKITVKGKVIKVLPEILGNNWIHLQDGSGDETKGNYDLVVTSKDLPVVNDVITVTGLLRTDKDFGFGKYRVIIEEASIAK